MQFYTGKEFLEAFEVSIILGKPLKELESEINAGLSDIPIYRDKNNAPHFHWLDVKNHPNACDLFYDGN